MNPVTEFLKTPMSKAPARALSWFDIGVISFLMLAALYKDYVDDPVGSLACLSTALFIFLIAQVMFYGRTLVAMELNNARLLVMLCQHIRNKQDDRT